MKSRDSVVNLLRRYGVPGTVLVILVLVLPVSTFLSRRMFSGAEKAGAAQQEYRPVIGGALAYTTAEILSLEIGPGQDGIGLGKTDFGRSISYEVAVPGADGQIWLVDHPDVGIPGARVRRYDAAGKKLAEFRTPAGTTLFTPGISGDLWVDLSGGNTSSESLMHYSGSGKLIATYLLPERLLARTLQVSSTGRVYVGIEQYWVDPDTGDSSFGGELVPVVEPDGTRVVDTKGGTVPETFIGADGNFYGLSGILPKSQLRGHPTFTVNVRDKSGRDVRKFVLPHGLRPYAADTKGRVYAEEVPPPLGEPYGHATLGELNTENGLIHVFDPQGVQLATVPVQRTVSIGGWASSAMVDKDGVLYSAKYDLEEFSVLRSAPVENSGARAADAKPGSPAAKIIITGEPPMSADPYLAVDSVQRDVWKMVFSGLVSHDASLNAIPDLSMAVPTVGNGVSADGRRITWKMRADRTWHDGQSVTAQDVVATWKHLLNLSVAGYGRPFPGFELIKDVVASDGEVTVVLTKPFGAAPECFFPFVLPAHLVNSGASGLDIVAYSAPVGSGPYEVTRFETARLMLSARQADVGTIRRIDVEFLDAKKSLKAYQSASVPTVWAWLPVTAVDTIERDAIGAVKHVATGRWVGTILNTRSSLLRDASVRRGLLSTHPVKKIRELYGDYDALSTGFFSRTTTESAGSRSLVDTIGAKAVAAAKVSVKPLVDIQKATPQERRLMYAQTERGGTNEIIAEQMRFLEDDWISLGIENFPSFSNQKFYSNYAMEGFLSQGVADAAVGTFPGFPDPGWGSFFNPEDIPSVTNAGGLNVTFTGDGRLRRLHELARASYDRNERERIGLLIESRVASLGLAVTERADRRAVAVMGISGYAPGSYPAGDFWNVADWRLE